MKKLIAVNFEMKDGTQAESFSDGEFLDLRVYEDNFVIKAGENIQIGRTIKRDLVKKVTFSNINAPEDCFENGRFDMNLGTDVLDCSNLERSEETE